MIVIPMCLSLLAMLWVGHHSAKTGEKRWHGAAGMFLAACGMLLGMFATHPVVAFISLSLVAIGVYAPFGVWWSYPTTFLSGAAAAGAIGFINSCGNVGGFVGPYLMGFLKDRTQSYASGWFILALFLVASGLLVLTFRRTGSHRRDTCLFPRSGLLKATAIAHGSSGLCRLSLRESSGSVVSLASRPQATIARGTFLRRREATAERKATTANGRSWSRSEAITQGNRSTAVTGKWSEGVRPSRAVRSMSAEITCQSRETPIQSIRAPFDLRRLESRERSLSLRAFRMREAVAVDQRRGDSVLGVKQRLIRRTRIVRIEIAGQNRSAVLAQSLRSGDAPAAPIRGGPSCPDGQNAC